jgi:phosphatidylethanolamine-binding protein (PEBP) family uncharacterized protein
LEVLMKVRNSSLATLLALTMCASLASCGSDDDPPASGNGGSTGAGGRGSGGSGSGGSTGAGGGTGGGTVSTGGSTGAGGAGSGGSGGGTGGSGSGGSSGDASGGETMGSGGASGDAGGGEAGAGTFDVDMRNGKLYFKNGQTRGTGQRSPVFTWTAHPEAMSYALSMYDRTNNNSTHWVMYDIPATVTTLPANLAHMTPAPEVPGAKHTSFGGSVGYFGPGAGGCNTYVFEVHAMKAATTPASGAPNAIRNTILPANRVAKTPEVLVIGNTSAGMCN